MEAVSVIVQYSVFRACGRRRRVFKMAPLHHHFEMLGWEENKVVVRFWIVQVAFSARGVCPLLHLPLQRGGVSP